MAQPEIPPSRRKEHAFRKMGRVIRDLGADVHLPPSPPPVHPHAIHATCQGVRGRTRPSDGEFKNHFMAGRS